MQFARYSCKEIAGSDTSNSGIIAKILLHKSVQLGKQPDYDMRRTKVELLSLVQQPWSVEEEQSTRFVFVQDTRISGPFATCNPIYRPTGDQRAISPIEARDLLQSSTIGRPNCPMPHLKEAAHAVLLGFFPDLADK